MATRGRKPQDPRSPEEIAAQPRKKGTKQPGIVGARKKVAAVKKEKVEKAAAREAEVAPRRKKSSPSKPFIGPKTQDKTPGESNGRALLEPEEMKKKFKQTPVPDVDVPQVRQAEKRRQDSTRLAQIGNADSLTAAEKAAMQAPVTEVSITKEAPSKPDPLRPKVEPLPENVKSPFATSGAFTFQGPRPVPGGETPTKDRQSYEGSTKVGKDLARRLGKGMGLPGPKPLKDRALEIATKIHERNVELGMAHPLDAPTIDTPQVVTGHPMRQAVVEHLYNTDEESIAKYASAKKVPFADTVEGLFNLRQQSEHANARVKLGDSKEPILYDADKEKRPEKGFDVDFMTFLTSDVKKPRPAISPRKQTHLAAQNIVEEISGPKRSGSYSGKAKGGVAPIGPMPMEYDKEGKEVGPASSGKGRYAPQVVKDLPPKPGKKAPGIYTSAAKDSEGGLLPTPTPLQKVVRSNRGRRATGASSPTYRLQGPSGVQQVELQKMEKLDTPPSTRFVAKEQEKQRKSKGRLAMAVRSGDDQAIQDAAWKHRGAQFTQTTFEGMDHSSTFQLNPKEVERTVKSSSTGKRTVNGELPAPEKTKEVIDQLPYSGFSAGMDRPQFATSVAQPKTIKVKAPQKLAPYQEKINVESDGKKVVTGQGGSGNGGYEQPFLTPSVSEAKLRERFPRDFDTSDGKKKNTWNPMSRQFLGGKEVPVSTQTAALQTDASKVRGKKDTPFEPARKPEASVETNPKTPWQKD